MNRPEHVNVVAVFVGSERLVVTGQCSHCRGTHMVTTTFDDFRRIAGAFVMLHAGCPEPRPAPVVPDPAASPAPGNADPVPDVVKAEAKVTDPRACSKCGKRGDIFQQGERIVHLQCPEGHRWMTDKASPNWKG